MEKLIADETDMENSNRAIGGVEALNEAIAHFSKIPQERLWTSEIVEELKNIRSSIVIAFKEIGL